MAETTLFDGNVTIGTKDIAGDQTELTIDLTGAPDALAGRFITYFWRNHNRLKQDYRVDFYPTVKGDNDFTLFFQYVGEKTAATKQIRPHDKKGVLRIKQW